MLVTQLFRRSRIAALLPLVGAAVFAGGFAVSGVRAQTPAAAKSANPFDSIYRKVQADPKTAGKPGEFTRALRTVVEAGHEKTPFGTPVTLDGKPKKRTPAEIVARKQKNLLGIQDTQLWRMTMRTWGVDPSQISQTHQQEQAEHVRRMPIAGVVSNAVPSGGQIGTRAVFGPPVRYPEGNPSTAIARWEAVGPNSYSAPVNLLGTPPAFGFGTGVSTGRVNHVTYDPRNPAVAYAATAGGGVWKTVNNGTRWTCISDNNVASAANDPFPTPLTSWVAVDPRDTRIVYVGLGDYNGSSTSIEVPSILAQGQGIMKSTDGGANFKYIARTTFKTSQVSAILIDPENSNILTVSTGRPSFYTFNPFDPPLPGIWRSTNGGAAWTRVFPADTSSLAMGARDTATGRRYMYAGVPGQGVYRSDNRGLTWAKLETPAGYFDVGFFTGKVMVAASPVYPNNVYATHQELEKIWSSDRGGDRQTWRDITGNLNIPDFTTQGFYDSYLQVSTVRSSARGTQDILYVGGLGIQSSLGATGLWRDVTLTYTGNDLIHTDQHWLAVNPLNANEMLASNDGGIFSLTFDPTRGVYSANSRHNATMNVIQSTSSAFHPFDPFRMLTGAQDNGTPYSPGSLLNWRLTTGGDGRGVGLNPTSPNIMYSSVPGGIFRTQDEWNTAVNITPPLTASDVIPFFGTMQVDAVFPHDMYIGTNNLWRYSELTGAWTQAGSALATADQNLNRNGERIGTVGRFFPGSISTIDTQREWIVTGSNHADVHVSDTGDEATPTFVQILNPTDTMSTLPLRGVGAVKFFPNPNFLLAAFSGVGTPHLYVGRIVRNTSNQIESAMWTNVSGGGATRLPDISANAVEVVNNDVYVGTDLGVFVARNLFARYLANQPIVWENANITNGVQTLPTVEVSHLKYVPQLRSLMATTYGRGIWRLRIP